MSKQKVDENNYVTIQAFMVNDLHLSGNELIVYAVIYGFSQNGVSWFVGSRSYLAAWCQTSEKSVTHNLNKLLDKNLIEKRKRSEHGLTFNDYRVLPIKAEGRNFPEPGEETSPDGGRNFPRTGEETSPHTIDIYTSGYTKVPYVEIVAYLNEQTGRNYNANSAATRKLIAARWNEGGRTLDDFKKVIDNKVAQWKGDPKMDQYLRPSTLFTSAHFDEYLNEQPRSQHNAEYSEYDQYFCA